MKNVSYYFLFTCFLLSNLSCANKEKLFESFNNVQVLIKDHDNESLYEALDETSKAYVDFCTDTTKIDFETAKEFGEKHKLTLFTTIYWNQIKQKFEPNDSLRQPLDIFFLYLKFEDVPMFNIFRATKILEDQSKVGSENYVVVGTKINSNTYLTSEVTFTKDDQGEYKLDLIKLIGMSEKILWQAYKNYAGHNSFFPSQEKKNLKDFIENAGEAMTDLKELKYTIGK